jgi:transposase
MITKTTQNQHAVKMVILEELVPDEHLLRKIEKAIPMTFIYDYVEQLYSKVGAPSIDPVRLFKMAFINRLYGITVCGAPPRRFG